MNRLRQIKRLTIRAPDRAAVWHGRRLLEDSFRTASLGNDASSRLIILHHLDIGQVPAGVPPNTIARQIEKQMQLVLNTAVYALAPEAERATAVFFHDEIEPFTALIQQLLSGKKPAAWFWPLCFPQYQPQAALEPAIAAIVQAAGQKQNRYPVIFPIWQTATKAGTVAALTFINTLAQMKPEELWRTLGYSRPSAAAFNINRQQLDTPALLLAEDQNILQKWLAAPEGLQPAQKEHRLQFLTWLVTLMLARATKRFDVNAKLITEAASMAVHMQMPLPAIIKPQTTAKRKSSYRQRHEFAGKNGFESKEEAAHADGRFTTKHLPPEHQSQRPPDAATAVAGSTIEPTDETAAFSDWQVSNGEKDTAVSTQLEAPSFTLPDLAKTNGGGLFFVIPILNRLGFLDFLEEWPSLLASDFPSHLLHFLCRQVEVAENDPVRSSIPPVAETATPPPISWKIPQSWQQLIDPDEQLLPLPQIQDKPQLFSTAVLLQIWHHALDQWCLHFTEMSLPELIVRPALVSASKTHIDVIFDINDIDIRVRRTGLDQNPGWVPWLARVVYFHFKDLNIAGAKDDR